MKFRDQDVPVRFTGAMCQGRRPGAPSGSEQIRTHDHGGSLTFRRAAAFHPGSAALARPRQGRGVALLHISSATS